MELIQPADVYARVAHLEIVIMWLAVTTAVTAALMIAKAVWVGSILRRVGKLLSLVELHGKITDRTVRGEAAVLHSKLEEITAKLPPAPVLGRQLGDPPVMGS